MGFKVKDRRGEIKTKLSKNPIHRKINRFDIIVTKTSTFLTLIVAYHSMLSSLSNVSASHMSDEDNGKQNSVILDRRIFLYFETILFE